VNVLLKYARVSHHSIQVTELNDCWERSQIVLLNQYKIEYKYILRVLCSNINMTYEIGYIYMIWDIENHNLTYYGSTKDFSTRINNHINPNNVCSSKQIIERGNYEYTILETYKNIDKYDLIEKEKWYIKNNVCVNKLIPSRSEKEKKEYVTKANAEYHKKNREKILLKFNCPCGGKYIHKNKSKHIKTNKHQKWIQLQNQ